jgi:hypothetical protein
MTTNMGLPLATCRLAAGSQRNTLGTPQFKGDATDTIFRFEVGAAASTAHTPQAVDGSRADQATFEPFG